MSYSYEKHLDNLIRHIELVRENCILLGKRLITDGRQDFGRLLIAKGFVHDHTKFFGIEWDYLHTGPDTDKDKLRDAVTQHTETNDHHPEYWGGIENMGELAIAEMCCDWYARAQEFGTDLNDWIDEKAIEKYKIDKCSKQYQWIRKFVGMLIERSFG